MEVEKWEIKLRKGSAMQRCVQSIMITPCMWEES